MRKKAIFYGWWIVLATFLIHFWGAGTFFYSLTAFFNPLVQEFKWSYAAVSIASSFRSLESGVAAPVIGFLTDRFGPRRLLLAGAVWAAIGYILLSRINSLWGFYVTFFFLSMGMSLLFPLPGFTAVANWFSRRRGTALGILVTAMGFSGVLIPLVNWLIAQQGWRTTFVITGVATFIISMPLSLLVRHRPEQYGYLPDGAERPGEGIETEASRRLPQLNGESSGLGVRQAMKTRTFWVFTLLVTISSAATHAIVVHVMPHLISVQIPQGAASSIAASLVVSSIAGRIGFGWLGDRADKRYLLALALLMQSLGLIFFAYTRSVTYAIVFLALFGPGFGGVTTLKLTIQGDYFGRKAFGSIMGAVQGIHMAGTIISPIIVGWVYDVRGSYQLAWFALAILVFLSTPLVTMLKPPNKQIPSSI
ncbi:MFS transporter [Chloroflexota bacterium]